MILNKIEVTKSKTFGSSQSNQMKFNKITVTLGAELAKDDNFEQCYKHLLWEADNVISHEQKNLPTIKDKIYALKK